MARALIAVAVDSADEERWPSQWPALVRSASRSARAFS